MDQVNEAMERLVKNDGKGRGWIAAWAARDAWRCACWCHALPASGHICLCTHTMHLKLRSSYPALLSLACHAPACPVLQSSTAS